MIPAAEVAPGAHTPPEAAATEGTQTPAQPAPGVSPNVRAGQGVQPAAPARLYCPASHVVQSDDKAEPRNGLKVPGRHCSNTTVAMHLRGKGSLRATTSSKDDIIKVYTLHLPCPGTGELGHRGPRHGGTVLPCTMPLMQSHARMRISGSVLYMSDHVVRTSVHGSFPS